MSSLQSVSPTVNITARQQTGTELQCGDMANITRNIVSTPGIMGRINHLLVNWERGSQQRDGVTAMFDKIISPVSLHKYLI